MIVLLNLMQSNPGKIQKKFFIVIELAILEPNTKGSLDTGHFFHTSRTQYLIFLGII